MSILSIKVRRTVLATLCVAVALSVSSCAAEQEVIREAHATRVTFYQSEDQLAAASSVIATVAVHSQSVVRDIDDVSDFTLSTVQVTEVVKGEEQVTVGETLVVRQHGSSDQPAPGPLLDAEGTYLLYLTPSGLPGELSSHFYITGATAGIYESVDETAPPGESPDETFSRFDENSGDKLPEVIDVSEATE